VIESFAALISPSLRELSGSVFYSGRNAFSVPSTLYLLGINPGGDPQRQTSETIAWHTRKVLEREPDDWSAYRNESWGGGLPGRSGMQPRVLHLLSKLGKALGSVPASNIAFSRFGREATFSGNLLAEADLCWTFHRAVIEALKPRAIVCFGKTTGKHVIRKLGAVSLVREFVEANDWQWCSQLFRNTDGLAVVVLTHPSVVDWTNPNSDPSILVAEALAG
jgi:hypothetical protein